MDELTRKTLRLGSGTNTRDRETDVDSRANTTEEKLSLQENLTVRNGDDLREGIVLDKDGTHARD